MGIMNYEVGKWESCLITLSPQNPITPKPYHPKTLSPQNPITLSPYHPKTLSPYHPITLSPYHLLTTDDRLLSLT
ncbi:MAG: hypothetical protein EWV55_19985 [Microcystis viridis Mv_BB_P_19951000_S69]|nr:MAG: hypothetical protein EWV55_19985 [Microcystis viridis Mv_BB_P_19951000_S69]TRU76820.1 MAG: hypothetical protein EWV47_05365 [Microcystis viridis Mv_BB_P_19951000_S68]